ncbi:MAG TPA: 30S ribosomal protein S16 [Candidatus Nanoarchaeia archaeon]
MVKIRLLRTGAKKRAKFRIVVADEQSKRNGRFIENIGHYNPTTDPAEVEIARERYLYWLSVGARPTKTVFDLFKKYEATRRVPS